MLIKFTRTSGHVLYIQAALLQRIEDVADGATVGWLEGDLPCSAVVQGSADENYTRLAEQERAAAEEYERRQMVQRLAQMPMAKPAPTLRGKQR